MSPEWLLLLVLLPVARSLREIAWYVFNDRMARRHGPEVLDKTKDLRMPTVGDLTLRRNPPPAELPAPPDQSADEGPAT